jgi:hypothetical protein
VIGLAVVFFPNAFERHRVFESVGTLIVAVIYGTVASWPKSIQQEFKSPNMTIRVVRGDLFDQPAHLVIGMCTTFDTAVPVIISETSVQGQFLQRVFKGDVGELDRQLNDALVDVTPVGSIDKPGKQVQYAVGEVATLLGEGVCYFCVAYTEMNVKNEARGTVGGIFDSLESLWRAVSAHGNGKVVAIPVIGGGQARVAQILPAQDSIRLMILSFVFASRHERVCNGLDIVVRAEDYEKLDVLEIQAFLRSLDS